MLDKLIASYGIGNHIDKENNKRYYHIYIVSTSDRKIFFCEDGTWSEDINNRAVTEDFIFAYEVVCEALDTEEKRNAIEATLLF